MENTRRSFLKKMTAAGIGTAGLALSSNAAATVTTETSAEKKKKPAGKDDGKLRFGFIGTGSRCHEHINNVLTRSQHSSSVLAAETSTPTLFRSGKNKKQ